MTDDGLFMRHRWFREEDGAVIQESKPEPVPHRPTQFNSGRIVDAPSKDDATLEYERQNRDATAMAAAPLIAKLEARLKALEDRLDFIDDWLGPLWMKAERHGRKAGFEEAVESMKAKVIEAMEKEKCEPSPSPKEPSSSTPGNPSTATPTEPSRPSGTWG